MRTVLLMCSLLLIPFQVFAVSYLRVNGLSEYTVTTLPEDVVVTCDLAQSGNEIEVQIYVDVNLSGIIDTDDILGEFLVITDGIGWIRDPGNPDEDITGDETPVDGQIQSTATYDVTDEIFFDGRFIIKVTDEDASTATAIINFDIQLLPPLITGTVTDAATSNPLQNIAVLAEGDLGGDVPEQRYGMTDANGDYAVKAEPGDWSVVAFDFVNNEYLPSDTVDVVVSEGETETINFQLRKYNSFVDGYTKKEDGTPVPGIHLMAGTVGDYSFSFGSSDESGYYKLGVEPGEVEVMANAIYNLYVPDSQWPEGYYVDPEADTVTVNDGQTVRVDFIFSPYTTFIEGDCTMEGRGGAKSSTQGLADVQITAMAMNLMTFEYHMSIALSDEQGHYRIGVMPGTVTMLMAYKDGFSVSSPIGGYPPITIAEGQTITGKDFTFIKTTGEMLIGGQVTYDGGTPANNVYAVAIMEGAQCRLGYRILYTDGSGNYLFDDLEPGYWKVGVYEEGYVSAPPMIYEIMVPGIEITDADFVIGMVTGVTGDNAMGMPDRFGLFQNYPNPFNPTTDIRYQIPESRSPLHTTLRVYNMLGQEVRTLVNEVQEAGYYTATWDGRTNHGRRATSGVYFYRLTAGDFTSTRFMVLMK